MGAKTGESVTQIIGTVDTIIAIDRSEHASACNITDINSAKNSVIAGYRGKETSRSGIATIVGTCVVVVADDGSIEASCLRIATVESTGISIIAIYSRECA